MNFHMFQKCYMKNKLLKTIDFKYLCITYFSASKIKIQSFYLYQ
jgi:hypothetical protein